MIFLRGNSTVIHRLVVATCCCVRYIFKSGEEKIKEVIFSQEDWLPTCLQAPGYKTGMHLQNACIILLQNIYIQLTYPSSQKSLYKTVININCRFFILPKYLVLLFSCVVSNCERYISIIIVDTIPRVYIGNNNISFIFQ